MSKKSPYNSKSIKTVLEAHKDEIYSLCYSRSQFSQLINKVDEILESSDLKGNESAVEAKGILNKCSRNYNLYLSTLMTYMTGIKVS